jgi:hypothetical protein
MDEDFTGGPTWGSLTTIGADTVLGTRDTAHPTKQAPQGVENHVNRTERTKPLVDLERPLAGPQRPAGVRPAGPTGQLHLTSTVESPSSYRIQ